MISDDRVGKTRHRLSSLIPLSSLITAYSSQLITAYNRLSLKGHHRLSPPIIAYLK